MSKKIVTGDFPGGPVVKSPCFHRSVPGWGAGTPYAVRGGGKGWRGGTEGGRENEGKKEGRKKIVWRDGNTFDKGSKARVGQSIT